MIIKYVRLHNIRSYVNQEIRFPEGSILLSGDIGSGKSTILLAIEFALFGIKRGDLSGEALLRNGKSSGWVELGFSIDQKNVAIFRRLKKSKIGVGQDSGWIEIDGSRKEASPVELKAGVLELLGYPAEVLTKGKDILFRYTVYTPQEAMKQILLEPIETRLDTLRKVFQIDKYKRIRENAGILAREMKARKKELEGRVADIDEKRKRHTDEQKLLEQESKKLDAVMPKLDAAKKEVEGCREKIKSIEGDVKRLNELNRDFKAKEVDLANKVAQREKNNREIEQLQREIRTQSAEGIQKKLEQYKGMAELVKGKKSELEENAKKVVALRKDIAVAESKISQSVEIKEKIAGMAKCPVCEQEVGEDHKHRISDREDKKANDLKALLESRKNVLQSVEGRAGKIEEELEGIRKDERMIEALKVKWANFERDMARLRKLADDQDMLKKQVGAINSAKMEITKEIQSLAGIEKGYEQAKKEYELKLGDERKIEVDHAGLAKAVQLRKEMLQLLEREIRDKEEARKKIAGISQYINWLEDFFVNLMATMEKLVMSKVHGEFDELFRQWFSMMIEDETLSVRIDDEFTPVVEQNGYETDIVNLSGGEKTSCALAYRLALNKVINELVHTIKTKDMIILDEPTDGFSSEQLDRVRDVIEEIGMKQVIIVSHEPKVESFVQHVIRIRKNEHVSEIV